MAHRLSPEAESELDSIWYYTATKSGSMDVAEKFVASLTHRFSLIAMNPYVGRRRDADLRPGMRSFAVGRYIILYRIEGKTFSSFMLFTAAGTSKLSSERHPRRASPASRLINATL